MRQLKIKIHGCFLGHTGYNYHTRNFATSLNKYCDVKVRNFTVDSSCEEYLTKEQKNIIIEQTLFDGNDRKEYPPYWKKEIEQFYPDIDIVLAENNHYYYYDNYSAPIKIAYLVWETTLLQQRFFDHLLNSFDYFWCPSSWQKQCMINQGYPEDRIFVVPEGVDKDLVAINNLDYLKKQEKFRFFLAGRWEKRKSTSEIVKSFLDEFKNDKNVELVCSIDNPFSEDGLSTEERLLKEGLVDPKIKIIHFPRREEYIKLLQYSHCNLSCSKSEGWGLTISDSIACGTPIIYAHNSAPIDFASEIGVAVKTEKEIEANTVLNEKIQGKMYKPDFEEFKKKMRNVFENYDDYKRLSLEYSKYFNLKYSWDNAGKIAFSVLKNITAQKHLPVISKQNLSDQNQCFLITSYCDNDEKLLELEKCINSLKFLNIPICLYSPIDIGESIKSKIDYFIYNTENELFSLEERAIASWRIVNDYQLVKLFPDHGYPALNQIKNGLKYCFNTFDFVHVINYDCILSSDVLSNHINQTKKTRGTFYSKHNLNNSASGLLFSCKKSEKLLRNFQDLSKESYINLHSGMMEAFLLKTFRSLGYKEISNDKHLHSSIDFSRFYSNKYDGDNFSFFFGEDRTKQKEDETCFVFFDYDKKLDITMEINSAYSRKIKIQNNFHIERLSIKWKSISKIKISSRSYFRVFNKNDLDGIQYIEFQQRMRIKEEKPTSFIINESDSLGDTIAWIPAVEEYRKIYNRNIVLKTKWKFLFEGEYKDILFCEDEKYHYDEISKADEHFNLKYNYSDCYSPLNHHSFKFLNIPVQDIMPKIYIHDNQRHIKEKYVCIATQSTSQCKYWNEEDWRKTVEYLKTFGYKVICIDRYEEFGIDGYMNKIPQNSENHTGDFDIYRRINEILHCDFFVGLSSGLSWVAWALKKPVVMISGFSDPRTEFRTPYRVFNKNGCNSCWNKHRFDNSDWLWCPENKNFECSKNITFNMVKEKIDTLIKDHSLSV